MKIDAVFGQRCTLCPSPSFCVCKPQTANPGPIVIHTSHWIITTKISGTCPAVWPSTAVVVKNVHGSLAKLCPHSVCKWVVRATPSDGLHTSSKRGLAVRAVPLTQDICVNSVQRSGLRAMPSCALGFWLSMMTAADTLSKLMYHPPVHRQLNVLSAASLHLRCCFQTCTEVLTFSWNYPGRIIRTQMSQSEAPDIAHSNTASFTRWQRCKLGKCRCRCATLHLDIPKIECGKMSKFSDIFQSSCLKTVKEAYKSKITKTLCRSSLRVIVCFIESTAYGCNLK